MRRLIIGLLVGALAWLGFDTTTEARIDEPGVATAVAVRGEQVQLEPPPQPPQLWTTESANGRCVGLLDALDHFSPGWDSWRMAGIAFRESRCQPGASNSCCSGLFQIHRSWISQLGGCGVFSRSDLYDPWKNVCSAAYVYRVQGMSAWSQTS